jgi:hypothetical protein
MLKEINMKFHDDSLVEISRGFLSLFSSTDGKIRNEYGEDGYGRKVVGSEG